MRYPDPNDYDSSDDYYDAIEAYEEAQRVKRFGYDGYEPDDDDEPDVDYDRAADDYFSQLSDNLEYNKYK